MCAGVLSSACCRPGLNAMCRNPVDCVFPQSRIVLCFAVLSFLQLWEVKSNPLFHITVSVLCTALALRTEGGALRLALLYSQITRLDFTCYYCSYILLSDFTCHCSFLYTSGDNSRRSPPPRIWFSWLSVARIRLRSAPTRWSGSFGSPGRVLGRKELPPVRDLPRVTY